MPPLDQCHLWPLEAFREQAQSLFSSLCWHQQTRPLSERIILELARSGQIAPSHRQHELMSADEHHARRVAYFLRLLSPESRGALDPVRVEIDSGRPLVADGKHRLAALWIARSPDLLAYSLETRARPELFPELARNALTPCAASAPSAPPAAPAPAAEPAPRSRAPARPRP